MPAQILTIEDLYSKVPAHVVNGYFDDARTGVIDPNGIPVQETLMAAEAEMFARLMRAYPGGPSSAIVDLTKADTALKMHLTWVALEYACERRTEFCDALGNGAYKMQFDRAITYFETLSKGLIRSRGESVAGRGANTGGSYSPGQINGEPNFTFARSKSFPSGHGGF
jgi:hypothetical protein